MGSFNIPCIVTKTPITPGDECVVVSFDNKNNAFQELIQDGEGFSFLIENYLLSVEFGKYDDYGNIEGAEHSVNPHNKQIISYAISKEAWDFIERTYLNDEFNSKHKALFKFLDLVAEREKTLGAGYFKNLTNIKENKQNLNILLGIKDFCYKNCFNPFSLDFENFYCGQQDFKNQKKQWNKLREKRI